MSSAGSLVLLQVLSRVLTFALNTCLARGLGPRWYALANVQLQLITSTALFLSREGVRRAAQRIYPGGSGVPLVHAINLAWLCVPITFLSATFVGGSAAHGSGGADLAGLMTPRERAGAVWMVCAAAVVEACAEPGWLYAQANQKIPTRAIAEGVALVVKVAATYYLTLVQERGAIGFGLAQLVYAVVYALLLYGLLARARAPALWPRPTSAAHQPTPADLTTAGDAGASESDATLVKPTTEREERWLCRRSRTLGLQYCGQCVQKFVLTEGERVTLVAISPLAQQGVFALISSKQPWTHTEAPHAPARAVLP